MRRIPIIAIAALVIVGALWAHATADETSAGDKLRILYSNQFTFTDGGLPLVTIELMSGQSEVRISADSGVLVRPDGDGGSEIDSGTQWTVRVSRSSPAVIREWTVVESFTPEDVHRAARAVKRWQERGYETRRFEIGTVFGVEGEVIDGRETLVAVAPVAAPGGRKRAREIAAKHGVTTRVHSELVRRPEGVLEARSGSTLIRNRSVLWFAPRDRRGTLTVADVVMGGGGSQLATRRETLRYFGNIYVTLGSDGKLVVVNAVPSDRLLAGLVPSEIFPDAQSEALAAQAIAARTVLLQKIGTRHLTDPYLLCASQHCQVYSGAGKEHPRTTQAVNRTRGLVLLRDSGGLIDARYSASCGGHGEHNDHIWGDAPDPALRGRLDMSGNPALMRRFKEGIHDGNIKAFLDLPPEASHCGASRYGKGRIRWSTRITTDELSRRIAEHYPRVGRVRALEPQERGISGRMRKLLIRGERGQAVAEGDLHIRRLLGGLRSSLFTVQTVGDSRAPTAFELRGAGFGHGVGMCQTGAIGMAERGGSYEVILRHYYPGSRVKRLY